MQKVTENKTAKENKFLKRFIVSIVILNVIGLISAINPGTNGIYVAIFVLLPVNFLFMLTGLIVIIIYHARKKNINLALHYSMVVLIPVATTIAVWISIALIAAPGGC